MRPGKARRNYPPDRLFVHECGRMAAPANPAGTVKKEEFAAKLARQLTGQGGLFVALFQIRRQHSFDPFHECADSAR
jgi:hypothetical protein